MIHEHRQYAAVRAAFLGLVIITFGSLGLLFGRLTPWLPYGFGQSTDCGCASIAFQVPPAIGLAAGLLVGMMGWLAFRWGRTWLRHARRWASVRNTARHSGRWMRHERTGISYWLRPDPKPQAYTIGSLQPAIIITSPLLQQLSNREFEAVLRHETAHAERRDPLWAALIDATGYMFGWPRWLQHWAAAAYSWRELAADADATFNYQAVDGLSGAVLKLSTVRPESFGVPFSPNADRIEKILNPTWTPSHRLWSGRMLLTFSLGFGCLLAAFFGLRQAQASLPPYPAGQCPRPVEAMLCQQRLVQPIFDQAADARLHLRCVRAESSTAMGTEPGWQCQVVPNRSVNPYAPVGGR